MLLFSSLLFAKDTRYNFGVGGILSTHGVIAPAMSFERESLIKEKTRLTFGITQSSLVFFSYLTECTIGISYEMGHGLMITNLKTFLSYGRLRQTEWGGSFWGNYFAYGVGARLNSSSSPHGLETSIQLLVPTNKSNNLGIKYTLQYKYLQ